MSTNTPKTVYTVESSGFILNGVEATGVSYEENGRHFFVHHWADPIYATMFCDLLNQGIGRSEAMIAVLNS